MTTRLPPSGHPELDWAARHMPLLARTFEEVGPAFAGLHLGITLHVEPKTAVLCRWLVRSGARVTITGNIGTTQQSTVEALTASGVEVLGGRDDTPEQRSAHLDTILDRRPDLVLDNGGDLISRLALGAPRSDAFRGATEETTTGGLRIRALERRPDFPVIVINDSRLKLLVENEFGVGQSVVQGFMDATNLMLPGLRVGVVGYGPCGRGTADALRDLGAKVVVTDLDPFRRLDAVMRGHAVTDLEGLLARSDVLLLATGARDVIREEHFPLLRDGVVIAGVGHEGLELDKAALSATATEVISLSPRDADRDARLAYRMEDGREVVVLHGTNMINLTAAHGNPIQAMDLGLALQARSLAAIADGRAPWHGAEAVPVDVDRALAEGLLALLAEPAGR